MQAPAAGATWFGSGETLWNRNREELELGPASAVPARDVRLTFGWPEAASFRHGFTFATFELLVSSVQNQVGWSVFLVLYLGQHYVCVCVRACFHVVLHVSGISGIQIPSLEHMLASLSLIC